MDIRNFLQQQGWSWAEKQRPSGLVAEMTCPFCKSKEKSFGVSLRDGAFSCLRLNECGVKGSFIDLQKMLGIRDLQLPDNNSMIYRPSIKYDKPKVKSDINANAIKWLQGRGIWEATSGVFKIGQRQDWIMFQYFKNGELVNVKYRNMKEKKFYSEKNAEPVLYGRDLVGDTDYIVIVEGEIDCLSMSQYAFPVVSIPSGANDTGWIEHEWDFLQRFKKIYLCLDNDTAGQKNIEEIVNRLGRWRCYNIILPYKDVNDCLMKDVPDTKIQECIDNAKGFDPPTLMKASDFEEKINYIFDHPEKMYGINTPWDKLTKILKGWRESELTIWSGRNGSGKSTILNDVVYNILKHKENALIVSLEMLPEKYLKWMLTRIKQKSMLDKDEVHEALKEIKNLFIVNLNGQVESPELCNIIDFAARKYGVKHVIIDSLMKVEINGDDKYDAQKNFCNMIIERLNKKYGIHTHLVAHPRKSFRDTDRPDKVDVSGSGDITNLADNVLALYRVTDEEKKKNEKNGYDSADMILYVKKNREWGYEGKVEFNFNPDTKTFSEV
jgi:twinkle protein